MNALEVLTSARALISDPARWTQGHAARDTSGSFTGATRDDATCWCTIGACVRVADGGFSEHVCELLTRAAGTSQIGSFNDTHTHAEVLAMFDQAITLAKAGGL